MLTCRMHGQIQVLQPSPNVEVMQIQGLQTRMLLLLQHLQAQTIPTGINWACERNFIFNLAMQRRN